MSLKIKINNLEKFYRDKQIISNMSFDVHSGEFLSIIGRSGCGKTTLLYLIAGFIDDFNGKISCFGKKGFVFQDHNLLPWKTVKENIEIGPINNKINLDVDTLIRKIDLDAFGDFYPHQLSEGMKQRVGIARTLANQPEILLMDEPFGSLDYFTRRKMQELLIKLKKEQNLTIVLVTHDIDEAVTISDRILVLGKSPCRILKDISINTEVDKEKVKKDILTLILNVLY